MRDVNTAVLLLLLLVGGLLLALEEPPPLPKVEGKSIAPCGWTLDGVALGMPLAEVVGMHQESVLGPSTQGWLAFARGTTVHFTADGRADTVIGAHLVPLGPFPAAWRPPRAAC